MSSLSTFFRLSHVLLFLMLDIKICLFCTVNVNRDMCAYLYMILCLEIPRMCIVHICLRIQPNILQSLGVQSALVYSQHFINIRVLLQVILITTAIFFKSSLLKYRISRWQRGLGSEYKPIKPFRAKAGPYILWRKFYLSLKIHPIALCLYLSRQSAIL